MGLISWDKPKKVASTEAHNNYYSSDSGIAGTYVPNMSREDMLKWKGKKFIKTDNPRIEIRKTAGSNILIVVTLKRSGDSNFKISSNGKIELNYQEMQEFKQVIDEAYETLDKELNGN
jgi:hypothetical protein